MPFNEVYTALQQGLVDGMVTSLNVAVTFKFYEACKYVVQNEFGLGLDKLMVAQRVWDRFTPEQQGIVQSTFDELEPADYFQKGEDVVPTDLKAWEDNNGAGTVLKIDPAAAMEAMAPLNKQMAEEVYGAGTWEEIQKL